MNQPTAFFRLLALLSLLLLFTACSREDDMDQITQADERLAQEDAVLEAEFEEMEALSFESVDLQESGNMANAILVGTCVTLSLDTAQSLLTVDFGPGCVGPDGKTRAGRLLITYQQRLWMPGGSRVVVPDSFYVDGRQIEGTLTLTNVSSSFQDPITINAVLVNGQVTWPNGDVATRSYDRTRVWERAANPANDQLRITGSSAGTTRAGVAYTTTIDQDLRYRRTCRAQGFRLPAEGIVTLQRAGRPDLILDFGTGDCDDELTLTRNGQSMTITL